MNAAIYIRVSTEDQTEYSPDAQKRALFHYAQSNDIIIKSEHIYIDEGISGRTAQKRPSFMRMIGESKGIPKPFDLILVHKFDRFARSREDSVVYKSLLKKEYGIRVISITESIEDDKFSVILEAMLEAMAEYYSLNLSEEVLKGMTEKARQGGYQSAPPLGYKMIHSVPVIVPQEAFIIKKIFHLFLEDHQNPTNISRQLNEEGFKTKRGGTFQSRSITYILTNPFYTGKIRWNQHKDLILTNGIHEPIISPQDFQTVQSLLTKTSATTKTHSISNQKHWLCGILKCSICGRTLTYQHPKPRKGGGSTPYFQCYGYSKGIHKGSQAISESKVKTALINSLKTFYIPGSSKYYLSQSTSENQKKQKNLYKELKKLEQKEERIKTAYIQQVDTLEEYAAYKNELQIKKQALLADINRFESLLQSNDNNNKNTYIQYIHEVFTSPHVTDTQKQKLVNRVIEKIIFDRKTESFEFFYHVFAISD